MLNTKLTAMRIPSKALKIGVCALFVFFTGSAWAQIGFESYYDHVGLDRLIISHRDHGVRSFIIRCKGCEAGRNRFHYEFISDTVFRSGYGKYRSFYGITGNSIIQLPDDEELQSLALYNKMNPVLHKDSAGFAVNTYYNISEEGDSTVIYWHASLNDTVNRIFVRFFHGDANSRKTKVTEEVRGDTTIVTSFFAKEEGWQPWQRVESNVVTKEFAGRSVVVDLGRYSYIDSAENWKISNTSATVHDYRTDETGLIRAVYTTYLESSFPEEIMKVKEVSRRRRYFGRK
jgi:hypothetical protein